MRRIWRKCLQEEEKAPLITSRHQSSVPPLALLMCMQTIQPLPLVVVNGITLCVCAECPKENLTFPLWYCFHTYIILNIRVLTRLFAFIWFQRARPPASFNHVFRSDPQMSESSYFHQWIQSLLISFVWQRITDNVFTKFPFPRDSEGTFAHLLYRYVPL